MVCRRGQPPTDRPGHVTACYVKGSRLAGSPEHLALPKVGQHHAEGRALAGGRPELALAHAWGGGGGERASAGGTTQQAGSWQEHSQRQQHPKSSHRRPIAAACVPHPAADPAARCRTSGRSEPRRAPAAPPPRPPPVHGKDAGAVFDWCASGAGQVGSRAEGQQANSASALPHLPENAIVEAQLGGGRARLPRAPLPVGGRSGGGRSADAGQGRGSAFTGAYLAGKAL